MLLSTSPATARNSKSAEITRLNGLMHLGVPTESASGCSSDIGGEKLQEHVNQEDKVHNSDRAPATDDLYPRWKKRHRTAACSVGTLDTWRDIMNAKDHASLNLITFSSWAFRLEAGCQDE